MDYKWVKKDDCYYLSWLDGKALMAFSTRKFYPAFKEDLDYMVNERKKILSRFSLKIDNLICPKQVHAIEIFQATAQDKGKGAFGFDETLEGVDILLTNEPGVILSVLSADCLAMFVYDPINQAVALAHIGWRGLAQGAVETTANRLRESFSSSPSDLILGLGPAIKACCYEVGTPVSNYFRKYLQKRDGKNYLDIPQVVKSQLMDAGVKKENIFDTGICTACKNEEFFSYRRENLEADRIMSIITLK